MMDHAFQPVLAPDFNKCEKVDCLDVEASLHTIEEQDLLVHVEVTGGEVGATQPEVSSVIEPDLLGHQSWGQDSYQTIDLM